MANGPDPGVSRLEVRLPEGQREVEDVLDAPLHEVLRTAGLPLDTRCGGRGLCHGCLVEPIDGTFLNRGSHCEVDGTFAGTIRACQHEMVGVRGTIRVPQRSLLAHRASVVTDFTPPQLGTPDPIWRQIPQPDGSVHLEHRLGGGWISFGESRDAAVQGPLGVAIDIGTTTVVVLLVDLHSGQAIAEAADFNHQMRFGDDVLTRISLCSAGPAMVDALRRALVERTIVPLVRDCLLEARRTADALVCGTLSGNTTMLHLFAGVDPVSLGVAPFTPTFLEHRILRGDLLAPWKKASGIEPVLHLLPGASAYVGADLLSGLLATGLAGDPGPSLLVDVGTNGEMLLKFADRCLGCATAAGPAFEGAGLSSGTRAVDGAISHVQMQSDPFRIDFEQVGTDSVVGICGSAYVDFLAEAVRVGLLNENGRLQEGFTSLASPECRGRAVTLARSQDGMPVTISESDVASLLSAKAAVAAGVHTLLEIAGLRPADLRTVYLAGGFGLHLDVAHAIACGLLPGIAVEQVRVVGNTSLAGALGCLLQTSWMDRIEHVAEGIEIIELNRHPNFEEHYISHLPLPTPG